MSGPATIKVQDAKGNLFKFNETAAKAFLAASPGSHIVEGEIREAPTEEPEAPALMDTTGAAVGETAAPEDEDKPARGRR